MEIKEEPLPLLLNNHNNSNGDVNHHHQQQQQKQQNTDQNGINGAGGGNSDSESQDSFRNSQDPNRFNAYLNRGSELWTHWTWMGGQGKMSLMKCNYCNINKQLKNAPKCRRHLIKCAQTPEFVRSYFQRKEAEASRVSAFMREIRSKEVKFPKNELVQQQQQRQQSKSPSQQQVKKSSPDPESKIPMPTANDLKHLQQKQQQSIHGGKVSNGNGISRSSSNNNNNNTSNNNRYSAVDLMNKTNILMNYSPMINRSSSKLSNNNNETILAPFTPNSGSNKINKYNNNTHNHLQNLLQQQQQSDEQLSPNDSNNESMINDINYNILYQIMCQQSMAPMSSATDSLDSSSISNSSPILASKLKRKLETFPPINLNMNGNGINGNINANSNGKENSIIDHNHHSKKMLINNNHKSNLINNNTNLNNYNNVNNIINQQNTVVINLDDVNDPIYFDSLENVHHDLPESLIMNGSIGQSVSGGISKKKKRDSCNSIMSNGSVGFNNKSTYRNGSNGVIVANNNGYANNHHQQQQEFVDFDSQDLEIVHDDLNDLLLSAFISQGIELEFVNNSYFQKFITQLVKFSTPNHQQSSPTSKNCYRLPTVDKLTKNNVSNLIKKFDYETTKIFSECDSIIVSFENNDGDDMVMMTQQHQQKSISKHLIHNNNDDDDGDGGGDNCIISTYPNNNKNEKRLNVNLLISSSNTYLNLFFKTIVYSKSSSDETDDKILNNQIDSLFNKLRSDQINAVILPYKDKKSSDLIYSYLSACHSHVVPLTNSYKLFHNLLCDICRIPSIFKLINQCIALFKELDSINHANTPNHNFDFYEESQNHWKQVFESDNLKILQYFLNNKNDGSKNIDNNGLNNKKNTYWISLNLMLCWFLVARTSIIKFFEKTTANQEESTTALSDILNEKDENLNNLHKNEKNYIDVDGGDDIVQKLQLEVGKLESFFDQISILFNFLTPFINAMHLIENESTVISDIIKIYYDVKLALNNNDFFNGINKVCYKGERQAIDSILNDYLQEHNFSRYFFLAYYLDPRFRDDQRIEENEELTAQVYDALFNYANALGCVNNDEEEKEKLIDSLEEFRNGDKLYGMQLLKCSKSPIKFWKHLRRFPGSAKLAYCAQRLLSISTKSMLITTPTEDSCTRSLVEKIMKKDPIDNVMEKLLPIKSYLLSSSHKMTLMEDDDLIKYEHQQNGGSINGNDTNGNTVIKWNSSKISNIISNVIISLDQYSRLIAQPFSISDLSNFIQQS